jgi:hypothetical protein
MDFLLDEGFVTHLEALDEALLGRQESDYDGRTLFYLEKAVLAWSIRVALSFTSSLLISNLVAKASQKIGGTLFGIRH